MFDKGGFFAHRVHASHGQSRAANRQHHARQAGTGAYVEHPGICQAPVLQMLLQRRDRRQTVEQMVREHLGRVAHSRQVVDLVPLADQVLVVEQALDLGV